MLTTGLLLATALSLPAPTGPYPVGTTVLHFTNSRRPDPLRKGAPREWVAQCWYPAASTVGRRATYVPDGRLVDRLIDAGFYNQPKEEIDRWRHLETHSHADGKPRSGARWPVLLFLTGLGMPKANYTLLYEGLASRGYFVLAIDTPHGGATVLPDGTYLSADDDPRNSDPAKLGEVIHEWAQDAPFLLDRLRDQKRFASRLDFDRAGMLGHSIGGAAALEAPILDPRIKASVNLDGFPAGRAVESGLRRPTLIMRSNPNYNDEDLKRLGRTREQWDKMRQEGKGPSSPWRLIASRATATVFRVSLRDTGHLSYGDAPYVMPSTITHFSPHPLDPAKTVRLTISIVADFFDWSLRGKESGLFDRLKPPDEVVEISRDH